MPELKGTKTLENLKTAFASEAQAYTMYGYYASQSKKDGYNQIADFFIETANDENEHAQIWFKYLNDNTIPETAQNLADAMADENYKWTAMYAGFAITAREEGFEQIAQQMDGLAAIEKHHEARYWKLLHNLNSGEVFQRSQEQMWICGHCGHTQRGLSAPRVCPVCASPRAAFQIEANNY